MTTLSTEATNFGWLLDNFVQTVPGTRHTLVVSADGLLMAMSKNLDRTGGDTLAAVVSGMASLTRGAARQLNAGEVRQSIIEMDELFLFLMSVSNGSVLAVAADSTCDVGLVGYEQIGLVPVARDRPCQRLRAGPALGVEFPEVGDRLLDDPTADPHRPDQPPVPVDLAVLPPRRVTQVH